MMNNPEFTSLLEILNKIPSTNSIIGTSLNDDHCWWVNFAINLDHPLVWQTVQELGSVLNYLSLNERLPTSFYPVSPPPYINGGPGEYLSWVIECNDPQFTPDDCAKWLEGRLPKPVDDVSQWVVED